MSDADNDTVTLFLGGDVMTGRGIDQVLPHPSAPELHEGWIRHAADYVTLAEERNGPIERPVDFSYVWGVALADLERHAPDFRIINLETSVTTSDDYQPDKGIHYRMHPRNLPCLGAAAIDCCTLANNHVLDWGERGLLETLDVLSAAGITTAGAGHDDNAARTPGVLGGHQDGRVLVFACGLPSSGIPAAWAAGPGRPGVHFVKQAGTAQANQLAETIDMHRRPGDVVVLSVHWGGNWGYRIPGEHRAMAHRLIESGTVDVVHGHSSHHPLAIEVYGARPILYGCGDLFNDYEGIHGYESFRPDLAFLYLVTLQRSSGELRGLRLVPVRMRRFRLERCADDDVQWLAARLAQQSRRFAVTVDVDEGELVVRGRAPR